MSQSPSTSGSKHVIIEQLRHPMKLRLCLCATIITGWYLLFYSPLTEQMAATTAGIATARKRVGTAREIEQLKEVLAPYQKRILAGADVNELMRHVIDHLRASPLKLIDLKPEKSKDLGPFVTIGLQLKLEGRFADIDEFLRWVETDRRLLRIDTIKLSPTNTEPPGRLTAVFVVLSLGEKPAAAAKTKPEAGKH